MMLKAALWLVINLWCLAAADCTYGNSPDCIFPCNCANPYEVCDVDQGNCSRCAMDVEGKGLKLWLRSTGPGCRVHYVAYNKPASSRGHVLNFKNRTLSPDRAVDGNKNSYVSLCFQSDSLDNDDHYTQYWWMVDLEAYYLIFNVTVYNRDFHKQLNTSVSMRLHNYRVYVSNASDIAGHTDLCGVRWGNMEPSSSAVLTCPKHLIGRYVSVVNGKAFLQHYMFALCEVVVIGVKAIDCSLCGDANCDPLYGCQSRCLQGMRTPTCDRDIDECKLNNPCVHGDCSNEVGSYVCLCNKGYTGINCDIDIDECESNPCVQGDCSQELGSYVCSCNEGYTGINCDIDIDECESNPCMQGDCKDEVDSYVCLCNKGYTGINCDIDIDECESNPCMQGDCSNEVGSYVCSCNKGYTGINCDQDAPTDVGDTGKQEDSGGPGLPIIMAGVFAGVFFIIVLIAVLVYRNKKSRHQPYEDQADTNILTERSPPVKSPPVQSPPVKCDEGIGTAINQDEGVNTED